MIGPQTYKNKPEIMSSQGSCHHPILWLCALFGACLGIPYVLGYSLESMRIYAQTLMELSPNVAWSELHENTTSNITKHNKQNDALYIFINGGLRNGDFLSPVLLQLQNNKKDYLIFSDEVNYNLSWNSLQKSHHIRVSTNHIKYLLEKYSVNGGKKLLINYMWTQILEYLIDNAESLRQQQYNAFIISENDIKICNQRLLDEFVYQFINDSTINVIHLWDSCTKGRKQPIAKKWGKFHLIKKKPCGGVAVIIKPPIFDSVLKCLYNKRNGKMKEQAMDGQRGGFASCNMLTFYPNELLLIHTGQYTSGISQPNLTPKDSKGWIYCNQTEFYPLHT